MAVGGNGAWELAKSDRMKIHGIDTVVVGEADELALDLFEDMEKGNAPELMNCFVKKYTRHTGDRRSYSQFTHRGNERLWQRL